MSPLSEATRSFCNDFARKQTIDALLAHFSNACEVIEHGLPKLAPFLGSPFKGHDGVRRYFSTLAALIVYENMRFYISDCIVDTDTGKVSVSGTATFTWIATNESWDETFTYVLNFDHEYKITRYQIWGDTGALFLASQGRLKEVSNYGSTGASFQSMYPIEQVRGT